MFIKDWNDVVDYVEGFTQDILSWCCPDDMDYDDAYRDLSRDIAYFCLTILSKYSH